MELTANEARQKIRQEGADGARPDVEAALEARIGESGGHAGWAEVCDEVGWPELAFRELLLALRDDPKNEAVRLALARAYRERGEIGRALSLFEDVRRDNPGCLEALEPLLEMHGDDGNAAGVTRLLEESRAAGVDPEKLAALGVATSDARDRQHEDAEQEKILFSDADVARFLTLFQGREDVHARQWRGRDGNTGYSPVREPLTPAVARNHLLGNVTVGVYPIRVDETVTFFALDLDVTKQTLDRARQDRAEASATRGRVRESGAALLAAVRELGFDPLYETSGFKGRHLWVFLERPEPARVVKTFGRRLLAYLAPRVGEGLALEFFPKQGRRTGKGLGNLIKLPLGLHRRTGRRCDLLGDDGDPVPDAFARLAAVRRASREVLHAAMDRLAALVPMPTGSAESSTDSELESEPLVEWTRGDFDTDPQVRHVLGHCPVLARVAEHAERRRRLTHDEQMVARHTLGYLDHGAEALNYLLSRCVDVGPETFLQSNLHGNPMSCPRIRRRIPGVTSEVECNCSFPFAPDRYPTPVLHLLTVPRTPRDPDPPGTSPAGRDSEPALPATHETHGPETLAPETQPHETEALERAALTFSRLQEQLEHLTHDVEAARRHLTEALRHSHGGKAAVGAGTFRLVKVNDTEELACDPPVEPPASGSAA